AFGLSQPSLRIDVVHLDAVEIVFGLGIDHSEHGVSVRLPTHVRYTPVITGDCDVAAALLPTRLFGRLSMNSQHQIGKAKTQEKTADELLHWKGLREFFRVFRVFGLCIFVVDLLFSHPQKTTTKNHERKRHEITLTNGESTIRTPSTQLTLFVAGMPRRCRA